MQNWIVATNKKKKKKKKKEKKISSIQKINVII